jgi:hypothetical protein
MNWGYQKYISVNELKHDRPLETLSNYHIKKRGLDKTVHSFCLKIKTSNVTKFLHQMKKIINHHYFTPINVLNIIVKEPISRQHLPKTIHKMATNETQIFV